MNDDSFAGSETGPAVHEPVDLPLDFEAYFLAKQRTFRGYAAEMIGDLAVGDEVAYEVFTYLAHNWAQALEAPDFEQHTWGILAGAVMYRVHWLRREKDLAARLREARRTLKQMHQALTRIEGGAGLYTALAELPTRQCEVFVLRTSMGYTAEYSAEVLGIHPRTVDYHHRRALAALERLLTTRHVLRRTAAVPGPRREGADR
ncbi:MULTISPECIES: sigma factor-like helix-turn-helix DNA-binding protein [unclassified Kitasatospora]|uniref:RNA polymerase sigma factor n=1 Tax=unclassified Kitasatospora TaxID=2633591 RepID=UPI0033C2A994